MIHRFRKITDGLYRGSAPSENDVKNLHKYLGINKIVSLDQATGEAIDHICNALGITHIMIPLNGRKGPLLELLNQDLEELLIDGGPTFIHCHYGKDRTGFVSALFQCMYMGYSYEDAMAEAKSLGFGQDVNPFIVGMYSNLLKKVCKQKEDLSAGQSTIVEHEREYKNPLDNRGSYLDQATQGSFAPFMSKTRQYPYDNPYNDIYDQSPTRVNYSHGLTPYEHITQPVDLPMVGYYSNNAGIRGVGPVENYGGFLSD